MSPAGYGSVRGQELCQPVSEKIRRGGKQRWLGGRGFRPPGRGVGEGWPRPGHLSKELGEAFLPVPGTGSRGPASRHAAPSSSTVVFAARVSPEHRPGGLGSVEAARPLLSTCSSQCRAPRVSPAAGPARRSQLLNRVKWSHQTTRSLPGRGVRRDQELPLRQQLAGKN